jgi:hypothetical protein
VFARTSEDVRIEGRRLDAPGTLRFRREDDPPTDALVIANPAKQSVIPGGATVEIMRAYAFLPTYVIYPSPGCWEFTIHIDQKESRIIRHIEAFSGRDAK